MCISEVGGTFGGTVSLPDEIASCLVMATIQKCNQVI